MSIVHNSRLTLSGSIGDITFRITPSGQVASQRVSNPHNPRTAHQQRGRMVMSHLTAFFTHLKPYLPQAFEGKAPGRTDTNAFVSANYHSPYPIFLPKRMRDDRGVVLAPYRVSQGTLPSIGIERGTVSYRTSLMVGPLDITPDTTIGQLSRELCSRNTSINSGDEIIYLSFKRMQRSGGTPTWAVECHSVVLDYRSRCRIYDTVLPEGFCCHDGYLGHNPTQAPTADGFVWIVKRSTKAGFRISTQELVVPDLTEVLRYGTYEALLAAGAKAAPFLAADVDLPRQADLPASEQVHTESMAELNEEEPSATKVMSSEEVVDMTVCAADNQFSDLDPDRVGEGVSSKEDESENGSAGKPIMLAMMAAWLLVFVGAYHEGQAENHGRDSAMTTVKVRDSNRTALSAAIKATIPYNTMSDRRVRYDHQWFSGTPEGGIQSEDCYKLRNDNKLPPYPA